MPAPNRYPPLRDTVDPNEEFDEQFHKNQDAADLRGVYLQNDTSDDGNVLVSRDASNNMTFTDSVTGTKTLAQLATASSGVTYYEFLLENDPTAETGTVDAAYTPTYSSNKITLEEWRRNDTTLIKSIAYTYTGVRLDTEVRKVFALDGTTIVAQVTWTYTYTGNSVTSASMTRDV